MKNSKFANYVKESIGELKKVIWPKKEEAVNLTVIVIIVIVIISAILGVLDIVFKELARYILS